MPIRPPGGLYGAASDFGLRYQAQKNRDASAGSITEDGAGIIPGAPPRGYNPASGGVPQVTSPVDTVSGNLGDFNSIIQALTQGSNKALREQYPDEYFSTLGTVLGNTQRRARGDISDLLPELQQSSAERAVGGGFSGSGLENTKLLRDIGLTRYGVENQAINDLSKIQSQIPKVSPFDPTGLIAAQLQAQERADLYRSAPIPEEAYQRALTAANRGGGGDYGGGGGGGGPRLPVGTADAALRNYSSGIDPFGPVRPKVIGASAGGGTTPRPEDNFEDVLALWNEGSPFMAAQTQQNYADFDPWFASMLDVGGGVNFNQGGGFGGSLDYGGGEGFYGGEEDFGLAPAAAAPAGGGDFFDIFDDFYNF